MGGRNVADGEPAARSYPGGLHAGGRPGTVRAMSSDEPTLPDTPDPARAAYEQSEARIAMHKQERELEATEHELEQKLESFGQDVEHTRQAEDAEYYKAHWNHTREETGDGAGADTSAADGER